MLSQFKKGGFLIHQTLDVDKREVRRLCYVRDVDPESAILGVKFLDTEECREFVHGWGEFTQLCSVEEVQDFLRNEHARLRSILRHIEVEMFGGVPEEELFRERRLDTSRMKERKNLEVLRTERARITDYIRSLKHQGQVFARFVELRAEA